MNAQDDGKKNVLPFTALTCCFYGALAALLVGTGCLVMKICERHNAVYAQAVANQGR